LNSLHLNCSVSINVLIAYLLLICKLLIVHTSSWVLSPESSHTVPHPHPNSNQVLSSVCTSVDSGSNGTEQHSTKPGAKPTSERWSSSRLSDHVPLSNSVFLFLFWCWKNYHIWLLFQHLWCWIVYRLEWLRDVSLAKKKSAWVNFLWSFKGGMELNWALFLAEVADSRYQGFNIGRILISMKLE
jgi:hypothetical protein